MQKFIDSIKIDSESAAVPASGIRVETVAAADEVLKRIAVDADTRGAYDKTWFTITLCDGSTYAGRIDVKYINIPQETEDGQLGLLNHIRSHCRFYLGLCRPAHLDAATYQQLVDMAAEQHGEYINWCNWLGIDLGDNPKAAEAVEPSKPAAITDGISVGDIWTSSWGYDQTNVDFYRVERVTKATVVLQEIGSKLESDDGMMSGRVVADPSVQTGKQLRRKVNGTTDCPHCKIESYSSASPWDGTPQRSSWYA